MGRLRHPAVRVLDCLGLVEDHAVPRDGLELLCIEAQQGVARDREIGLGVELASGSVVATHAKVGSEALGFLRPVREHARRRHHQRPAAHGAQGLERLAEAHVVGEQRGEAGVAQAPEPGDAFFLIVAQCGLQTVGERGAAWRRRRGRLAGSRFRPRG